jgi:hypothetical protein
MEGNLGLLWLWCCCGLCLLGLLAGIVVLVRSVWPGGADTAVGCDTLGCAASFTPKNEGPVSPKDAPSDRFIFGRTI